MKRETLIGLVGHPSSGKDTVAAHLVEKYDFVHLSSGDMIRAYIQEHELGETDREKMKQVSTMLREQHGSDYIVRMALKNPAPRLIVSGLRAIV